MTHTATTDTKRDYSKVKLAASDLDGTLIAHGINGYNTIFLLIYIPMLNDLHMCTSIELAALVI